MRKYNVIIMPIHVTFSVSSLNIQLFLYMIDVISDCIGVHVIIKVYVSGNVIVPATLFTGPIYFRDFSIRIISFNTVS